jgi:Spy/CpxP family protein refolding chaperone
MKNHLTILSLASASLITLASGVRAEDPVPPTPPVNPPAGAAVTTPDAGARPQRPGGAGGRMDPAARMKLLVEKLGLTPEQQEKIKAIYEKNAPAMKEFMAKGRENLTAEDKMKVAELMKTQREEIAAVLTPEQKEKFKELRPGGPGAGGAPRGEAK